MNLTVTNLRRFPLPCIYLLYANVYFLFFVFPRGMLCSTAKRRSSFVHCSRFDVHGGMIKCCVVVGVGTL